MTRPRISIIGLGKLGAPMAACFGSKGFDVVGVDVDERYVEAVNTGRAPVYEPELEERLQAGRDRIRATTDTVAAVRETDVTMVIVPTPSEPEGGFSLRFVLQACEQIGRALRNKDAWHLVGITSTVMPGSTGGPIRSALEEASGKRAGIDFGLCYSPEFIALGSVVRDFLNPDFLLVGESDPRAGDQLASIYKEVCDVDAPVARMNFVNAELAKLAVNTFVTTKIAFANMLARICEQMPEADVDAVTAALGLDSRIGPKYLKGAISYGGPCFPRDNMALAALARSLEAPAIVAEATDRANRDGIHRLAELVRANLRNGGTVGILGLSYKPNTDVVEESPGLLLAAELAADGIDILVHDPAALENAQRALDGTDVRFANTPEDCVCESDVVVVATPWKEFRELSADVVARESEPRVVIDCWRVLPAFASVATYIALGEGIATHDLVRSAG